MANNIQDKVIIITGASDGIGAAAARELKSRGAHVAIVGRSQEKTKKVASELNVPFYLADFAKFDDVRKLAEQLKQDFPRIDVLANNAGSLMAGRKLTIDGFESTIQVNHLSPFLLTSLLLDTLLASHATIINTSSVGNRLAGRLDVDDLKLEHGYNRWMAYGKSKLMNILFTKELHAQYHAKGISTAAFHPGIVRTNFSIDSGGITSFVYKTFLSRFLISAAQGADTLVWLATSNPGIDWNSGEFYTKRKILKANNQAYSSQLAKDLWEKSLVAVGLK